MADKGLGAFIRAELSGWKTWEALWLLGSCAIILGLALYWQDTPLGIIASVTGVAYTVCNGKGKRLAFLFGMVNSALYAVVSFQTGLLGEAMLNGLYYLPMMFVGLYAWNKRMDSATLEVQKRRMSTRQRLLLAAAVAVVTAVYAVVLSVLGDALPIIDSFTTSASVIALIIAVKRYEEQWPLWTAVNGASIVMWAIAFANGAETVSVLAMWVVYFATGVIMWMKWQRDTAQ